MSSGGGHAILGVSADYHDAAAAVVVDGRIVAAAAEERFTRVKHDPSLPRNAMAWCLEEAGIGPGELATVAFYDKPLTAYERVLITQAKVGPRGFPTLAKAVGQYTKSKLWIGYRLERALRELGHRTPPRLVYAEHHQSHAAAAFYPSPFESAAILTFDGLGEWATSSIGRGDGARIEIEKELRFPDSIGLLYSAATAYCGFEVNDGEYKLMGLAPYGTPRFADALREQVVHIGEDGAIHLDQRWFAYRAGRRMMSSRMAKLLDGPPRRPGDPLTDREADIAASVQLLVEEIVLRIARHAHDLTGEAHACLGGGVALNCVANGRLLREGPFDDIWIQPAAGDDGSAIGAALWAHHRLEDHPRPSPVGDGMAGAFLGPAYGQEEVAAWLRDSGVEHTEVQDRDELVGEVADALADGSIVGWFQGRMEFGPRALGHRSILADPRDPTMVTRLNQAVKRREGFRPFAPAVPVEDCSAWFDLDRPAPYMLLTAQVADARRLPVDDRPGASMAERLATPRSEIPACTHVDGSARVQTVDAETDPLFHALLRAFGDRTGCPVLVNTSFNRRDEPIVRTPADALRCALETDIDLLVVEGCVVRTSALRAAGAAEVTGIVDGADTTDAIDHAGIPVEAAAS